ncbi:hypothetical protein BU26DRAFT_234014 [Trematosphaeria pertusa]|uniref:F-box domain-containing protein n=1 Tax=Trematosphaeria pertusa TaxID=390896 RepID=A0A6A6ITZ4_9PLEO|nr:uncharacterized protein BU26DRAFT_234014 [Trematosphaeria pertusa]KAF2254015.1 hypothetical protein BU26DRAFT_234014 [Trematosphaeria pertusa]
MACSRKLPNEILLDIFERLQDSPTILLNAMKCCRRWHRLASAVLYTNVSIDSKLRKDSTGARFAKQVTQCDLVQSFSLQITQVHLMGFNIFSTDAFDRLTELCDVLARMKNLRTFALSFEEPDGQGFSAPGFAIVSILNSLPKGVVNLNLDCDRISRTDLGQPHSCHALSALIPRLRSLRLRTSLLCSGLLASIFPQATLDHERDTLPKAPTSPCATSSLEYVLIHLTTYPEPERGPHTALCFSGDKTLHGSRLASMLGNLYEMGAFPRLRQFAVIGRVDATPSPRNDTWNVFKARVLTKDFVRTTTLPWCARGGSSSLYMIRDQDGDWFGSSKEISRALEGPLAWTHAGIKAPQAPQADYNSCWKLDHSQLIARESVIEKFGVSFRLWKHEHATGLRLLDPRTATGFADTAAMTQLLPPGWVWVPEGPWNWTIEPEPMETAL